MARKKWIDKKSAAHFTLVHRPQNDPLIHDASASSLVLNPTTIPNVHKSKKLDDLKLELGLEIEKIRQNEGEAANHGIFYDDTEYDYMQHLRDLGSSNGESYFVEAPVPVRNKGKQKQSLDEALKNVNLKDHVEGLLDQDILPSKNLRHVTYQAQQEVPDALAGLQPDMDPRLREVLIALEDEEYLDEEDDNIFNELAKDNQEIDQDEFVNCQLDSEEAGWDSDTTAKPNKEYQDASDKFHLISNLNDESEDHGDGAWMASFHKMKNDQKLRSKPVASSLVSSAMMTNTTNGGKRKKRKGALTNPSSYSMTSSSLYRTEGLTALDAKFEKIEEQYNEEIDDMASISQSSFSSTVSFNQQPVREDLNSIMDEFLGSYSMSGKKHIKKGKYQNGIDQLDEIRRDLGPAIIRS